MHFAALVNADLDSVRHALAVIGHSAGTLARTDGWRALRDILFDVALVGLTIALVELGGWHLLPLTLPLALLVVGNRQRSLGNLLHEASHYNLSRHRRWNDLMATALLAPLMASELSRYRRLHQRHHRMLGDPAADPDLLPVRVPEGASWRQVYLALMFDARVWREQVLGDLQRTQAAGERRFVAFAVMWWLALASLLAMLWGRAVAGEAVFVWFLARATTYHAITQWREMCDHHGLETGGVFRSTRDILARSLLTSLVHPRNDSLHLTHHLLPTVPYHRLAQAQRLLQQTEIYRMNGVRCDSYFSGDSAVVRSGYANGRVIGEGAAAAVGSIPS